VSTLESRIDDLYKGPLDEFTARRNALAKSLGGAEAQRVKRLAKPPVVAWAINQVYWHERPVYERIRKSGEKLRAAQLAALKRGRSADLRAATDAHRNALGDAVAAASKIADAAGVHPSADGLMRTFEALSLAAELPEPPGRLTRPLQPAGFEALTGVSIPSRPVRAAPEPRAVEDTPAPPRERDARAERQRERERAADERRRKQAGARAEALLARAQAHEQRAREAWERAKRDVDAAEQALAKLRQ
jgi:hypothetical protein